MSCLGKNLEKIDNTDCKKILDSEIRIFNERFADYMKTESGQKYRPSNGLEGEIFKSHYCRKCTRDKNYNCAILSDTLIFNVEDERYPKQWTINEKGQPECTEFEELTND